MSHTNEGSITVSLVLIVFFVVALLINHMRICYYLEAMGNVRYACQREFRLVQMLMVYGIYVCMHNAKVLLELGARQQQEMSIEFKTWPDTTNSCGPYSALLIISSKGQELTMVGRLMKNSIECKVARSILALKDKTSSRLSVKEWYTENH